MPYSNLSKHWFSNIRGDLLAGIVVALALIPEAIAFSIIAGALGVGLREPLHVTGSVSEERHGLLICRADRPSGMHMARASARDHAHRRAHAFRKLPSIQRVF
jgi:hypothetical protein